MMIAKPRLAVLPGTRTYSLLRAATGVTVAGIVVKLVATAKEFVVAAAFGRSDPLDAFLIAYLLPNLLINLLSESMGQALVPALVREREERGHKAAEQLLANATLWLCLILMAASLLAASCASFLLPMVARNFSPVKLVLTTHLFYALLPVVLMTGIAIHCASALNSTGRFLFPALAPVVTPAAMLLGAWLLAPRYGIWSLVFAALAGSLLHVLLTIWLLARRGYLLRIHWYGWTPATAQIARQYGPMLLSGISASGGLLVDQGMAATLAPGSVATLAYGNRFGSVITMLLAGAVSTTLAPHLAQLVARKDWMACRSTLIAAIRLTSLVALPVTALLIFGSPLLVRLAFQHGHFNRADTQAVFPVQSMYALGIPFFVVSRVCYRFLLAMRRSDLILWCGVLNLILDIALNLLCMRWLGVAGIALATSLWMVSTFLFLFYWTWRLLPINGFGPLLLLGKLRER